LGNDRGLWLAGPSGDLMSIAQNGLAAPGTDNGVVFSWLSQFPALNGAGQFAFQSTVRGPGVTTANETGIWSNNHGNGVQLVLRAGDAVPGFPGANFSWVSEPKINEAGTLAFAAGMDQGLGVGLWTETADHQFTLIHRSGAAAPGVATPVALGDYYVNGAGRMAFIGYLGGTTGMQGIWAQDAFGELKLIAKSGDQIDVGGVGTPNVKTIDTLYFGGFNDSRQVAFSVLFTDRTGGVFISHLAEVPEPKGLGIVFLCFGLLFAGERMHPPRHLTRFCGRTFP
jgi:hypothetical protein